MVKSIIRTDKWILNPSSYDKIYLQATVGEYRVFCKALSYVILGHWARLQNVDSKCAAIEKLIHQTKKNPIPLHKYFRQRFWKFPSYLRRAAIEFAWGQVSSYLSRYRTWQSGIRKRKDAKPPVFNPIANCYPVLYGGNLIKFNLDYSIANIKVWNGSDWVWSNIKIITKRNRHLIGKRLSPYLVISKAKCHLAVPFKIEPIGIKGKTVCAIDVGINTLATAVIVTEDGTVTARKFFHPSADIDRRDRQAAIIRKKARKTKKLHQGFCKSHYRKAKNISFNISHQISKRIVDFANFNSASVIVFENLKGWKPKGGRKRSGLKQKFHTWMHRRLVQFTAEKFEEVGGKVEFVDARGTSSWAYDGSGKLKRSNKKYSIARFQTGKIYNCDLSAAGNIAARYWAYKLKLTRRKDGQLPKGKRPIGKSRMPITLSDLWDREAAIVLRSNQ
ncbi:MAG: transposase [Xenococcaceae cyanobacterium MO_207.B15]|nr:transposase [Xenococcaceae cyanobacterium MO_207.B15]